MRETADDILFGLRLFCSPTCPDEKSSPITTIGTHTVKKVTASSSTPPMANSRYKKPTNVLMAISTTLVGVAVFSVTRNNSVRIEKVQMSIPLEIRENKTRVAARVGVTSKNDMYVWNEGWMRVG